MSEVEQQFVTIVVQSRYVVAAVALAALWTVESIVPMYVSRSHRASHAAANLALAAINAGGPDAEAEDLVASVLRGVPKDQKIVLYCSVGVRSAAAATRLVEVGFTNVHNLTGIGRTLRDFGQFDENRGNVALGKSGEHRITVVAARCRTK